MYSKLSSSYSSYPTSHDTWHTISGTRYCRIIRMHWYSICIINSMSILRAL